MEKTENKPSLGWTDTSKRVEAIILFIFLYGLNFFIVQKFPELVYKMPFFENITYYHKYEVLITLLDVLCLIFTIFVLKIRGFKLFDLKKLKDKKMWISMALSLVILIAYTYIFKFVASKIAPHLVPPTMFPPDEKAALFWLYIPTAVISGPIFEELIFRGLLLKYVFAKKPILGLIITSIIFIAIHGGFSIEGLFIHGVPGVVLGLSYLYAKNIESPIIAHSLLNLESHLSMFM